MSDTIEPEVCNSVERKARRLHTCCECKLAIDKGTRYIDTRGIWDGTPQTYKTCKNCEKLRKEFTLKVGETPPFHYLKEGISEEFYGDNGVMDFIKALPNCEWEIRRLFSVRLF